MENSGPRRSKQSPLARRSSKRKREDEYDFGTGSPVDLHQDLVFEIRTQIEILDSTFSSSEKDRESAKQAISVLSELAKSEDIVNDIVDCTGIPQLVRHLQAPPTVREGNTYKCPYEHVVEKASAFILGLLAIKPKHQQLIVDAGALPHLVNLLKRRANDLNSKAVNSVIRRAADAITSLAHENGNIKSRVRVEGGIPPLVELLQFVDTKVQIAAAGAIRTLAFKNGENKNQIVECNALPVLISMLRSEDVAVHFEAVGVIGNLVHSSPDIKKAVLAAGALQPVIGLLSVCAKEKLLCCLGNLLHQIQFARFENVQRMVGSTSMYSMTLHGIEVLLSHKLVALALAHLCSPNDQKTIFIDNDGLPLLLELLSSTNSLHQRDSSMALCRLANKSSSLIPMDSAPLSPTPQVYLGKQFYAHRICLLASSDAFRAMFDGGYRERDAKDIDIPNIKWDVFELMMRYIYTGSIEVNLDISQDLLRAADQYLLEGLKRLCEYTIAQDISEENVSLMFELSEAFNAMSLRQSCILFVLEKYNKLSTLPWYSQLIKRILPDISSHFVRLLSTTIRPQVRE